MVKNIPLGHERRRLRLAGNGRVGKAGNAPYRANLFIGRRRRYSPRGAGGEQPGVYACALGDSIGAQLGAIIMLSRRFLESRSGEPFGPSMTYPWNQGWHLGAALRPVSLDQASCAGPALQAVYSQVDR